jgi:hypothetical protein
VGTDRLPAEFGAWQVAGRRALDAAAHADEWQADARADALAWLAKHKDLVAAVEARVLLAEREAGTWGLHGDRDLAGFTGRLSRRGRGDGFATVDQASTLAAMPQLAQALADGPVTTTHVAAVSRETAASPALAAALATDEGQAELVAMASRWDGAEFRRRLRQMGAEVDPVSRQRSHDEQRERRHLTLTHTAGGTQVAGLLDLVAGHTLALALEAYDPRPTGDDDRNGGQRRADALVALAQAGLVDRPGAGGLVAPVQAVVTISEATWAALRARRPDDGPTADGDVRDGGSGTDGTGDDGLGCAGRPVAPGAGSATHVLAALRGTEPVCDETGTPWPASEIGRALCGCALTRAVVDAAGQVLDLGRDVRLFTRTHWVALYAAGHRTCSVPGCTVPLRRCELHHIRWWDRDCGRTDLSNCAPVCGFHHHEIHRRDIRVTRMPGGSLTYRHPDGRLYGGTPLLPPGQATSPPDRADSRPTPTDPTPTEPTPTEPTQAESDDLFSTLSG